MLWIVLTAAAAPLQVARNVFQRGLIGEAGPWGATLVRFLFGLPFSILIFSLVAALTPGALPHVSTRFWLAISAGALAQMGATAALLVAMHRSGFAVATVMQQAALPLGAIVGWLAFGDRMDSLQWWGLAVTSLGLTVLSWPRVDDTKEVLVGSVFGLTSGACFAVALNGYRQAGLALDQAHPIYAATAGVVVAQTLQSVLLGGALAVLRPGALRAVASSWRASLGAGFCGALASAFWFSALALAPAGPVRAVGVIEAPIAAAAGRRLFKEKLTLRQLLGGAATAIGVVMTALG
ncbi:MAG: multidrug transporter [Phenylobacterium zucineum]|nr:MAG: multidrug transporter [Phenylobacterium zucineum]